MRPLNITPHFGLKPVATSMAIPANQEPGVDYFSLTKRLSHNDILTPDSLILGPSLESDSPICSPISSDFLSPLSPDPPLPPSWLPYDGATKETEYTDKKENPSFKAFDDWMPWDDQFTTTLSSSINPHDTELKVEPASPDISSLDLLSRDTSATIPTSISNTLGDNFAFQDQMLSENVFQSSRESFSCISGDSPRARLYSTPLSWEKPRAGYSATSTMPNQTPYAFEPLTAAEEAKLRSIAMPDGVFKSRNTSVTNSVSSEPESRSHNRKRKQSTASSSSSEFPAESQEAGSKRQQPPKKTAHNMIEKRYRTNLNDKIALLRDSVPSLRVARDNSQEQEEDLDGLTPAHKLNKATILSKATEYINHLEYRNRYLSKENAALKERIQAFEILMMSRGNMELPNGESMEYRSGMSGMPSGRRPDPAQRR